MSILSWIGAISQREHDRIVARADAVIDSASAHLDAEEFNEGRTLPQKVAIAVRRLSEARSNAFKNRQRYLTAEAKLADVTAELAAMKAERDRLDAQLEEARHEPWPEWATAVLKVIRSRSGYDGYDDAIDGVDLPNELEETMAELEQQAEKRYQEARVDREVEQHKSAADHYRAQANSLRPDAQKWRDRKQADRDYRANKRKAVV